MSVYTQADLDVLLGARLNAERSVTFSDGRRVDFVSDEELSRKIEAVRRELEGAATTTRLTTEFTKGVNC